MDIDPLQDTLPPRYAIESDEEEDETNPLQVNPNQTPVVVDVKFIGSVSKNKPLILAAGKAGVFWAKGAELGEQAATLLVNDVQVGVMFNPSWTQANVIVSEGSTRLPINFMDTYARHILEDLVPPCVSFLDEYSAPIYSSHQPISLDEAPIRYLTITNQVSLDAKLFEPPNLIQSTSASFLSILSIQNRTGTIILLPSAQISQPAPKTLFPSNLPLLSQNDSFWPSSTLRDAHRMLLQAVQEGSGHVWKCKNPQGHQNVFKYKRAEVGEGTMYI